MVVNILKAQDHSLVRQVRESLSWCRTAYLGVAYAKHSAYKVLKSEFEQFLRNGGKLRLIFDIEKFITDREIIEEFATIPGDCECKVFIRSQSAQAAWPFLTYHPKSYLFFDDQQYSVIIGSSNLTMGGLEHNIECNLCVSGSSKEPFFSDILSHFQESWKLDNLINVLVHGELLEEYQSLYHESEKDDTRKEKRLARLRTNLDRQANQILESQKRILNEKFSYLLGLISANSEFDSRTRVLKISLERGLANSGKPYEGYYHVPQISDYKISQQNAHSKDVEKIKEELSELIAIFGTKDVVRSEHTKGYTYKVVIEFDKESPILRELLSYAPPMAGTKVIPFVPKDVLTSDQKNIVLAFLRGYCDLRSRITLSDGFYRKRRDSGSDIFSLRMGISISSKHPELVDMFKKMFLKIGLDKGVNYERRKDRENLIRIDVRKVPKGLLGTHWKRIFLSDFQAFLLTGKKVVSKKKAL